MTGADTPPDDPLIPDDYTLLRRVHPRWVVLDGAGGVRLASGTFQDLTDDAGIRAMSVFVEDRLAELGRTPADLLSRLPTWGLVAVSVQLARKCGLGVVWAPLKEEGIDGEAHAHVFGRKSQSVQKQLVAGCDVRVWPREA